MMPIGAEVKIRKDLKLGVLYKNRNNKRAIHACRGMLLLAGKKAFITNIAKFVVMKLVELIQFIKKTE